MKKAVKKGEEKNAAIRRHVVHSLKFEGDDPALVRALKADHPGAYQVLYQRYAGEVLKVLHRVMGPDTEMDELLHEVFIRAFRRVDAIRDPEKLRAWLTGIALFVAAMLAGLYSLRVLPLAVIQLRRPRDIPGSKDLMIALAWVFVAVALPLIPGLAGSAEGTVARTFLAGPTLLAAGAVFALSFAASTALSTTSVRAVGLHSNLSRPASASESSCRSSTRRWRSIASSWIESITPSSGTTTPS